MEFTIEQIVSGVRNALYGREALVPLSKMLTGQRKLPIMQPTRPRTR